MKAGLRTCLYDPAGLRNPTEHRTDDEVIPLVL